MYHRHHQNRNAIDERQRPDQPIATVGAGEEAKTTAPILTVTLRLQTSLALATLSATQCNHRAKRCNSLVSWIVSRSFWYNDAR